MSMFGGSFIHIMFFGLGLRIFLRAMHFRIRNHAGDRDRVTDVITQLVAIAREFPSAALRRSKSVLVGVVAFLQAARERPCFIVSGAGCVLRHRPASCASNQEQRKKCNRNLHCHRLPPKSRFENWNRRPGLLLIDPAYLRIRRFVCKAGAPASQPNKCYCRRRRVSVLLWTLLFRPSP